MPHLNQQNPEQPNNNLSRRESLSLLTAAAARILILGLRPGASNARAQNLYRIQPLSEPALLELYILLLEDACRYADRDWKSASFDPAAGYWGDGVSGGNGGIRTIVSMLLACGALLKYDNRLGSGDRRKLLDQATAGLRFVTATHLTGAQKCTDGKSWGATPKFGSGSWQSGMWTGTLAFAAWLVWDKLDSALRQACQRIIAWEADILSRRPPPHGLWLDTKAEENGWEVPCLVLAELMFPSHPRAAAWHEAALLYMMNTLCTEADTHDPTLVDGRPVNQWVNGANLQPDFTLENHNFFHPSYVGCSCYFLTQAAMYYTYGGRPVPQAATHHLLDTWRMFQSFLLPWGEAADPQGMDWELHSLPFVNLYASLATRDKDPFAAHMEQSSLEYMRAWQSMGQGDLAFPGSRFGMTRHAINAEQASYGFLAHKIFGPAATEMTARATAADRQGVRVYPYVGIIAHRTLEKFASFSWKNRIMGLLIPIGAGHENNPAFSVPITNGFVGSFELGPSSDLKITVLDHSQQERPDGFEASATLLFHGGRLKQILKMISIGSQTVIYEDRVTALADVTVESERGVPIGIENDQISGGARVVSSQEGQTSFDWKNTRPPLRLPGSWVNVDRRLGVVMLAGAGLVYAQASGYSRGICVYTDILYGSCSDDPRPFKAGSEVAHRLAVFSVEVTPKQTSALAQSCRMEEQTAGPVLRFKQPDGKPAEVPLLSAKPLQK